MEETPSLLFTPAAQLPAPLATLVIGWALATGLTLGSFLNVVIARLPAGESVVSPRSRCPRCFTQIAWYDNVPVLSWLLLKARCRSCGLPISSRYPLIELLIGGFAAGIVARFGLSPAALELFIFATVLVALAFIDIDTYVVPFELLLLLLGTGALFGALGAAGFSPTATPVWLEDAFSQRPLEGLIERAIGAAAGFLLLGAVNVVFTYLFRARGRIDGEEWAMGWGDPLLLGAMGAVLGWRALPLVVFLASVQGSIVGIALMLSGRLPGAAELQEPPTALSGDAQTPVARAAAASSAGEGPGRIDEAEEDEWTPPATALPFVPFLALAGLEVAFFGGRLFNVISPWFSFGG